jgi:hypothetical protein
MNISINNDSYTSKISHRGSTSTWNISSRPFLFISSTRDEFRPYLIQYRTQLIYIKDLSHYILHSQGHHSSNSALYYLFIRIPCLLFIVNTIIKILLVVFINAIKKHIVAAIFFSKDLKRGILFETFLIYNGRWL